MMDIVFIRNKVCGLIYKKILRPLFFLIDPEITHNRILFLGRILGSNFITRGITSLFLHYSNEKLEQNILGIKFKNPVGLAAGFDKDAYLTNILPSVGFGFAEVGSISGEPYEGNPGKRLYRLKKSKSIVVNYGLKNQGAEKISQRLKNKKFDIPIGISVAKTNSDKTIELENGIKDYLKVCKLFENIGDYLTINISCPNAFGGEPFTDEIKLEKLLSEIDKLNYKKPVFIKLPPDLDIEKIDKIINVTDKHKTNGLICSNLTKDRNNPKIKEKIIESTIPIKGSLSGKIIEDLVNEQIRYIYSKTKGKYIIMGCGGVFSAEDAYKKIKLGATLIQLITGMIFEGPQLISEINRGLVKLLEKDGFKNISEAIGVDNR